MTIFLIPVISPRDRDRDRGSPTSCDVDRLDQSTTQAIERAIAQYDRDMAAMDQRLLELRRAYGVKETSNPFLGDTRAIARPRSL